MPRQALFDLKNDLKAVFLSIFNWQIGLYPNKYGRKQL
jgi:hypothetical protein